MKYLIILSYWFWANLIVRVVNAYAGKLNTDSFFDILELLLMFSVPILFYNMLFILFFNEWSKQLPFISLELISLFFALLIGVLFQIFVFKQALILEQVIGIIVVVLWVLIMNKTKILMLLS